jgi:hypothetical protein
MKEPFSSDYEWEDTAWRQLIKQVDEINGRQHMKGSKFYIYGIGVANVDTAEGTYYSMIDIDDDLSVLDIVSDIVGDARTYYDLHRESVFRDFKGLSRNARVIHGKLDQQTAAGVEEQEPEEE